MAEAVVEERQLLKTLRWYDGFVICLANPGFLLGSLGCSVVDLGGWGAALIWGITAAIVFPVTDHLLRARRHVPEQVGRRRRSTRTRAWRKYTTLIGPVATFGYWIGWSVVLSFLGLFTGYIAQAAWFPHEPYGTYAFGGAKLDNGYFSTGSVHIGLQHLIAIGLILARLGLQRVRHADRRLVQLPRRRPADGPALLLHAAAVPERRLPLLEPDATSSTTPASPGVAAQIALVWIWIMIWSTAPEAAATFAPEYKDTVRGHEKGPPLVGRLHPADQHGRADRPDRRRGSEDRRRVRLRRRPEPPRRLRARRTSSSSSCALSFLLSMNTATADGSRALYGISRDGLTIKELGRLNRFNVPGNAMTLDMGINILFVLFVGNLFGILVASNIGYVLANMFAIARVRPAAQGPPELAAADQAPELLGADRRVPRRGVRALQRGRASAGSRSPAAAPSTAERRTRSSASRVLAVSLLLFLFRRIVQDKERPHWREETPTMPDERARGYRRGAGRSRDLAPNEAGAAVRGPCTPYGLVK